MLNLSTLTALNPNGSVKWRYVDQGIMFSPIVSPTNSLVLMGGVITYGQPGFIRAVGTDGKPLWRVDLPTEPGFDPYGQVVPQSRPRFTGDGKTAYIATNVAGDNASWGPCWSTSDSTNPSAEFVSGSPRILVHV